MSTVREQAAAWFMRMRDAAPGHPDWGRFEAWRAANPAHEAAYAAQVKAWGQFDNAADIDALADRLERRQEAASRSRRRALKQGALGLLVTGTIGGFAYRRWRDQPLWQSAFATGIGQTSTETLPDGSTLVIGADTSLRAAFSRSERSVWLNQGEVVFDVARNPGYPFIIDAGLARVIVLGTRFVVTRFAAMVRVSVEHGRVQVESGPFWHRRRLILTDGLVAEVNQSGEGIMPPQLIARPAADDLAFEHGTIIFDGASLDEIAETLSRYRAKPVYAGAGAQTVPPLTAVAHLSNIEGFLGSLPNIAPIVVTEEPGRTILSAAE